MPNIVPEELVDRIGQLLSDKSLERKVRDSRLREVAQEAWNKLFPEDSRPERIRLSAEARMRRWQEVSNQLLGHPDRARIIRVLESPASGERFHWVDQ